MPVAAGVLIALCVHGVKATARPVVNATTAGFGAPVVSTVEDVGSVVMSLVAILLPILVLVGLIAVGRRGGLGVPAAAQPRNATRLRVFRTARLFG